MTKRPSIKTIKQKGDRVEREIAKHIASFTGLPCERAPLSGGGVIGQLNGGADLLGTPGLHVEVKGVERASFPEWIKQAEKSVAISNAPEFPIVINKRNRQPHGESFVFMRLDSFLHFYEGWLTHHGYKKDSQ